MYLKKRADLHLQPARFWHYGFRFSAIYWGFWTCIIARAIIDQIPIFTYDGHSIQTITKKALSHDKFSHTRTGHFGAQC
jgi:hypothetical protein